MQTFFLSHRNSLLKTKSRSSFTKIPKIYSQKKCPPLDSCPDVKFRKGSVPRSGRVMASASFHPLISPWTVEMKARAALPSTQGGFKNQREM